MCAAPYGVPTYHVPLRTRGLTKVTVNVFILNHQNAFYELTN